MNAFRSIVSSFLFGLIALMAMVPQQAMADARKGVREYRYVSVSSRECEAPLSVNGGTSSRCHVFAQGPKGSEDAQHTLLIKEGMEETSIACKPRQTKKYWGVGCVGASYIPPLKTKAVSDVSDSTTGGGQEQPPATTTSSGAAAIVVKEDDHKVVPAQTTNDQNGGQATATVENGHNGSFVVTVRALNLGKGFALTKELGVGTPSCNPLNNGGYECLLATSDLSAEGRSKLAVVPSKGKEFGVRLVGGSTFGASAPNESEAKKLLAQSGVRVANCYPEAGGATCHGEGNSATMAEWEKAHPSTKKVEMANGTVTITRGSDGNKIVSGVFASPEEGYKSLYRAGSSDRVCSPKGDGTSYCVGTIPKK